MADKTLRRRMAWTALLRVFKPGTPGIGKRLAAIPRMIKATFKREYDGGARLAMLAAAGVYIISPIDAVPEAFLLVFGLVDDLAVAGYFAGALMDELERFLEWEKLRDNVIPGHVVR
ncbi:YkvA family protein [Dactylosporangium sp. CA-092794]|uniref:YkvA family protein n=1 Tax=Dactylosporangium sp. CA-092794 TaxID=3239929 RepID=UPI003D8C5A84